MKYVITFERTVRLGLSVFEAVGPFDSVEAAKAWLKENIPSLMGVNEAFIGSMLSPESVKP